MARSTLHATGIPSMGMSRVPREFASLMRNACARLPVIVTRRGKPVAVLMSLVDYEALAESIPAVGGSKDQME